MKKLTLELDKLVVDSFEVAEEAGPGGGTVRGHLDFTDPVLTRPARTMDVSCYCETENCETRITCYSCESCQTCGICIPL